MNYDEMLREVMSATLDARTLLQVERLSGNVVKEEFWKGQLCAFNLFENWITRLKMKEEEERCRAALKATEGREG